MSTSLNHGKGFPGRTALSIVVIVCGLAVVIAAGLMVVSAWDSRTGSDAIFAGADKAYHAGDSAAAMRILLPLANANEVRAQLEVGNMFEHGDGVPRDLEAAFGWYRKAAAQGSPDGEINVGLMYARGAGVERDDSQALRWFQHAADRGSPKGFSLLGDMYAKGLGGPKDEDRANIAYRTAAELYEDAAQRGSMTAISALGFDYLNGRGVAKDEAHAVDLLRRAAAAGDTFAQLNLSYALSHGVGTPRDEGEAAKWFKEACKRPSACDNLHKEFP